MNEHTESMKRREANNVNAIAYADSLLMGELPPVNFDDKSTQSIVDDAQQALSVILARYDMELAAPRRCVSVEDMLNCILEPRGIMFCEIDLADKKWQKQKQCILAFLESGEAVALYPSVKGYRYTCPSTGKKGRVDKQLKLQSKAHVIFRPYVENTLSYGTFITYLLKLTTPRDWIKVISLTAGISLLSLIVPILNSWVLESLVPEGTGAYQALAAAAVLFVSVELISAICIASKNFALSSLRIRLEKDVQGAFLARALMMPLSAFRQQSTGSLSNQMRNCSRLVNVSVDLLFVTSITSLFSVIYIPQMISFAPALLIPAIIVLAVELLLSIVAALLYANNQRKTLTIESEMRGEMFSIIKGIGKIKSAGATNRVYGRWARTYRKLLELNHNPAFLVKIQPIIPSIMSATTTVILYAVAFPAEVTGPEFIAFNATFALTTAVVRQVIRLLNSASTIVPLIEQLKPTFEVSIEQPDALEYVRTLEGKIEVESIGFTYGNDAPFDIRDITLTIEPGEKVAFVGTSGCGKSTVLRIIMGLEEPSRGRILFDSKPIEALNRRSLSKQIGSVFQFSRVMPGTIRDNVAFGTGNLTDDEIWEALDNAAIGDAVRKMPQQLDTEISETAAGGFSGGQKQCLLLARAFARKPPILVLDEATSALDNITQQKVIASMHASKATVLMVAHRLSTVKQCDRIVVMDKGAIVEIGSYDELMELDGLFARLVAGQITDK